MTEIRYCKPCNLYTLTTICTCKSPTTSVIPQKFSPQDKYEDLKRKAGRETIILRGLL